MRSHFRKEKCRLLGGLEQVRRGNPETLIFAFGGLADDGDRCRIEGLCLLKSINLLMQSSFGLSPRSNAAYTDLVRVAKLKAFN